MERGSACVHLQLLRYCKVPTGEWERHGLIFFPSPSRTLIYFFRSFVMGWKSPMGWYKRWVGWDGRGFSCAFEMR